MPEEDKTFTQAQVDSIVEDRLKRERQKYSDYDDLKAKASKFDELEASNKTDLEKANARAAAAEQEAASAKAEKLRLEVAAEKGVKPRYVSGATREELEASADEYLTDHPAPQGGGGQQQRPAPAKPTENLTGGGDPSGDTGTVETDPAKLAATVSRF